jgi:hypothetical protein
VFGNLYLTDKRGAAEFSSNDESLAVALAAAAWHASMAALSTAVLTSDEPKERRPR